MRKSRSRSSGERFKQRDGCAISRPGAAHPMVGGRWGVRMMQRSFVRVHLCLQSHSAQMPTAADLRATVDDMTMRRVEEG